MGTKGVSYTVSMDIQSSINSSLLTSAVVFKKGDYVRLAYDVRSDKGRTIPKGTIVEVSSYYVASDGSKPMVLKSPDGETLSQVFNRNEKIPHKIAR